jgi:hypothetical protein
MFLTAMKFVNASGKVGITFFVAMLKSFDYAGGSSSHRRQCTILVYKYYNCHHKNHKYKLNDVVIFTTYF